MKPKELKRRIDRLNENIEIAAIFVSGNDCMILYEDEDENNMIFINRSDGVAVPKRINPDKAKNVAEASYIEGWNACVSKITGQET